MDLVIICCIYNFYPRKQAYDIDTNLLQGLTVNSCAWADEIDFCLFDKVMGANCVVIIHYIVSDP